MTRGEALEIIGLLAAVGGLIGFFGYGEDWAAALSLAGMILATAAAGGVRR